MSADSRAEAAQRAQLLRYTQLQRRQRELIIRALNDAKAEVLKTLSGAPSDWQRYRLREIEKAIDASLARFTARQIGHWTEGANLAWALGQALVDAPLTAALGIKPTFNAIDDRVLLSMRTWMVDKIKGITLAQRAKITAQLQLAATGAQGVDATIKSISAVFDGDRSRAITITRTELGRAFSHATWLRLKQAAVNDPDLRKQWRRSGKRNSRDTHDFADGQVKPVLEFFRVGGVALMYPRDPTAAAKHTINCGCTILPWKESWAVSTPGPKPFSPSEIAAQPKRADASALIAERVADANKAMQSAVSARFGAAAAQLLANPFVDALRASADAALFDQAFNNALAAGLSADQSAALSIWTIRGQDLNRALIDKLETYAGQPMARLTQALTEAVRELPSPSVPVLRWISRRMTEAELDEFVPGSTITTPRFMSASLPGGVFIKPGVRPSVTFEITPKLRSRAGIVDNLSWKPGEREVLFPPGTKFRVLQYRRSKGRHTIVLEEI